MNKTIVITDLTQMPTANQVCVAGISDNGECIRPICSGGFLKSYLYTAQNLIIKPAARIEFDFTSAKIEPPHIEDQTFTPASIVSKGLCNVAEWEDVLKTSGYARVEDMYEGYLNDFKWLKPGSKTRSLATLSAPTIIDVELSQWEGKLKYRLSFKDNTGHLFDCPVNDLAFKQLCYKRIKIENEPTFTVSSELTGLFKKADRVYIRLGLARPWVNPRTNDVRCYLQITGIYTFPDYLQGKTFADFLA